jgi:hypothetical protein
MNNAANPASGRSEAAGQTQQDSPPRSADQRMRQAVARIEASRSALIVCLAPEPPTRRGGTSDEADGSGSGSVGAEPTFAQTLAARIERNGLLQGSWRTLRTLARRWWTRQPWHSSVDLVVQTLAHQTRPLMQRHPMATLAVGAAVGAGLVAVASAVRPWAWHQIRGKASPWGDRVGGLLWAQLTSAPVQMAVAGALTAWLADQGRRHPTPSSHSPGGAAPQHTQTETTARGTTPDAA